MKEESIKYRRTAIIVLAKMLDDICPTYDLEEKQERKLRIKERVEFFKQSEKDLDAEWKVLEKEAFQELAAFKKDRDLIFSKLQKTNNSHKVKLKVNRFESKKKARVDYLVRKMDREIGLQTEKLSELISGSKKYLQIQEKSVGLEALYQDKIRKSESRYNTIIKNTINSDNSQRVARRLEHSGEVWKRKYQELKKKHQDKEDIFNNKSTELDQIRIALDGFAYEKEHIAHWCTLAGVTLRECYTEAIKRARMVNRNTSKLDAILKSLIEGS